MVSMWVWDVWDVKKQRLRKSTVRSALPPLTLLEQLLLGQGKLNNQDLKSAATNLKKIVPKCKKALEPLGEKMKIASDILTDLRNFRTNIINAKPGTVGADCISTPLSELQKRWTSMGIKGFEQVSFPLIWVNSWVGWILSCPLPISTVDCVTDMTKIITNLLSHFGE